MALSLKTVVAAATVSFLTFGAPALAFSKAGAVQTPQGTPSWSSHWQPIKADLGNTLSTWCAGLVKAGASVGIKQCVDATVAANGAAKFLRGNQLKAGETYALPVGNQTSAPTTSTAPAADQSLPETVKGLMAYVATLEERTEANLDAMSEASNGFAAELAQQQQVTDLLAAAQADLSAWQATADDKIEAAAATAVTAQAVAEENQLALSNMVFYGLIALAFIALVSNWLWRKQRRLNQTLAERVDEVETTVAAVAAQAATAETTANAALAQAGEAVAIATGAAIDMDALNLAPQLALGSKVAVMVTVEDGIVYTVGVERVSDDFYQLHGVTRHFGRHELPVPMKFASLANAIAKAAKVGRLTMPKNPPLQLAG